MTRTVRVIQTGAAPAAIGPYSQAVVAGGWVFLSGQIALDPSSGELVSGGVAAQTRQVLANLSAVLAAAGTGLEQVVRTTVYLKDLGSFGEVNAIYGEFFKEPCPARATVEVARLPRDALVEMDAVALAGEGGSL